MGKKLSVDISNWDVTGWDDDLIKAFETAGPIEALVIIKAQLNDVALLAVRRIIKGALQVFVCGDKTFAELTPQGVKLECQELKGEDGAPQYVIFPWKHSDRNDRRRAPDAYPPALPALTTFFKQACEDAEVDPAAALAGNWPEDCLDECSDYQ